MSFSLQRDDTPAETILKLLWQQATWNLRDLALARGDPDGRQAAADRSVCSGTGNHHTRRPTLGAGGLARGTGYCDYHILRARCFGAGCLWVPIL